MTTATMQLIEPMNFSRSCLDKSIASISKGLIGSPCCGRAPSSPRLALKPLYENKVTTVQSAKPSPKSPTKEQKKQDSAAVCVTKDLIGVKDKPWNKACEAKPKKSSEVDNGELIEILNENRQQTKPKAHKSCRRNMSIDVASLSHSNNESLPNQPHTFFCSIRKILFGCHRGDEARTTIQMTVVSVIPFRLIQIRALNRHRWCFWITYITACKRGVVLTDEKDATPVWLRKKWT